MPTPPALHYQPFSISLSDGTVVTFAPVTPMYKELIKEAFKHLSQASRYLRFGHPVNELSEAELQYLTNVDQQYHIAWGALIEHDGKEVGIGVGRYVHTVEKVGNAEFALTVIDEYQNKSIGRYLLAILYVLASRQGLTSISGSILPSNSYAAGLMIALGAKAEVEDGLYYARLPIFAEWGQLATPYGQKFAETLSIIDAKLR